MKHVSTPHTHKLEMADFFPQGMARLTVMVLMGYIVAAVIGLGIFYLLLIEEYLSLGVIGSGIFGGIVTLYFEMRQSRDSNSNS